MKNLLIITFRGILLLKLNGTSTPDVVIVLNQVANNAINNVKESLGKVIKEIMDVDQIKSLLVQE